MKRKTISDLIEVARTKGVSLSARKRADGSYRITSLGGVKYRDSEGNNALRKLMGASLSKEQRRQRKEASPIYGLTRTERRKVKNLNKLFKSTYGEKYKRYTYKRAFRSKKFYGAGFYKMLKNSAWHTAGLAYRANIQWLGEAIKAAGFDPEKYKAVKRLIEGNIILLDSDLRQLEIETSSGAKAKITLSWLLTLNSRLSKMNKDAKEALDIAKSI